MYMKYMSCRTRGFDKAICGNIVDCNKADIEMKNKEEPANIDRSVLGVRDCLWGRL